MSGPPPIPQRPGQGPPPIPRRDASSGYIQQAIEGQVVSNFHSFSTEVSKRYFY
jgi:hypothetical protein